MSMPASYQRGLANIRAKVDADKAITAASKRMTPERMHRAMGRAVAYWHAQVLPKVPVRAALSGKYSRVGRGQLKKRTQPYVDRAGSIVVGGLMFMTHYAIWLVAGTRRIAGGRVMSWKEGDPPVTSWPAKSAGGNPRGEMPIGLPQRRAAIEAFKKEISKEVRRP